MSEAREILWGLRRPDTGGVMLVGAATREEAEFIARGMSVYTEVVRLVVLEDGE